MRIIVVGGGISGLAAAHFATLAGHDVVCLSPGRPGGLIESHRLEGFLCEAGPQAILDGAPDTNVLLGSLGLAERAIFANPIAKRRFIFVRGALRAVPTGPPGLLTTKLLSRWGRFRLLLEPLAFARRTQPDDDDESVLSFGYRRLGAEAAHVLLATAAIGIYAGDARELSIASAFPRLAAMERDHGSLLRGAMALRDSGNKRGQPLSFPEGLGELPDALGRALGERVWPTAATAISPAPGQTWRVDLSASSSASGVAGARVAATASQAARVLPSHVEGDAVIVATDAPTAAGLLGPLVPEAERLRDIPTAPIAVCSLGFNETKARPIGMSTAGYGFLVARGEAPRLLGCQYESSTFTGRAPEDAVLLRGILGGIGPGFEPEILEEPDDQIVARTVGDLRKVAGLTRDPDFARVWRHPGGIPQYRPGHLARVAAINNGLRNRPGLYLVGHALRGVGVNECIRTAREVVNAASATMAR